MLELLYFSDNGNIGFIGKQESLYYDQQATGTSSDPNRPETLFDSNSMWCITVMLVIHIHTSTCIKRCLIHKWNKSHNLSNAYFKRHCLLAVLVKKLSCIYSRWHNQSNDDLNGYRFDFYHACVYCQWSSITILKGTMKHKKNPRMFWLM